MSQADPVASESATSLASSRQARLHITRLDPWSVAKSAFMLGVTIAGVLIVATIGLWLMLSAAGVFDAVTSLFKDVSGNSTTSELNFLSLGRLVGLTMVVSAAEILLLTVISSLFATLYNLSVGFTGGIQVTLSDRNS